MIDIWLYMFFHKVFIYIIYLTARIKALKIDKLLIRIKRLSWWDIWASVLKDDKKVMFFFGKYYYLALIFIITYDFMTFDYTFTSFHKPQIFDTMKRVLISCTNLFTDHVTKQYIETRCINKKCVLKCLLKLTMESLL